MILRGKMIIVQRRMNNGVYHGIVYNTKTKKRLNITNRGGLCTEYPYNATPRSLEGQCKYIVTGLKKCQ